MASLIAHHILFLFVVLHVVVCQSNDKYPKIELKPNQTQSTPTTSTHPTLIAQECRLLGNELSLQSQVVFQSDSPSQFQTSVQHFFGSSASVPACVVLPGSANDLRKVVKHVAAQRIPFAVSGGKHSGNPGFSSTSGIQIDMRRFRDVVLSEDGTYADIGAGLTWDQVYAALQGTGKTVLGGRTTGVGVGGYVTGGGGYSFLTNQYGLCVESILKFDMVLPNGTFVTASAEERPDLFWAVKGGGNQFGIFYNVRLRTFPHPKDNVWGGTRFIIDQTEAMKKATLAFLESNQDPKAAIIPTFNWFRGIATLGLVAYYDGPLPPNGTFAAFDNATSLFGSWGPTTLAALTQSQMSNQTYGLRGRFNTISVERYTKGILDVMSQEGVRLANDSSHSGVLFSLVPENYMRTYGQNYTSATGPYPYARGQQPMEFLFQWSDEKDDAYFVEQIKGIAELVRQQAIREGQDPDSLALYANYALAGTPAERLYGQENAQKMHATKQKYSPSNVTDLTTFFVL